MGLPQLRRRLDLLVAEHRAARAQLGRDEVTLAEAGTRRADEAAAQEVCQKAAEAVQREAHRRVAAVVGRCLKAVFGAAAYDFRCDFVPRRGRTEAELLLVNKDGSCLHPWDAVGGGVCDVTSFALRAAALMLARPRRRKFPALDEPFRHLSAEHRPAAGRLVEALARELGVQFLVVTHSDELRTGRVAVLGRGHTDEG